jgi:DNA-nicking Smr family endonuclease
MNSEKKNTEDRIFRRAMVDVTPLRAPDRIEPVAKMTPAVAVQEARDERAVLQEMLECDDQSIELETGEELLFLRAGYQKRILRRLRRGHYSAADSIDLHHMGVETAKQVLLDFLDQILERQLGCVRIIHGKGLRSRNLPQLKIMTNRVLRKHPRVIAYASCRPVDGGTGATDVLLSTKPGGSR